MRTEIERQIEATKKRSKDVERFEFEAAQRRPNLEEIQHQQRTRYQASAIDPIKFERVNSILNEINEIETKLL